MILSLLSYILSSASTTMVPGMFPVAVAFAHNTIALGMSWQNVALIGVVASVASNGFLYRGDKKVSPWLEKHIPTIRYTKIKKLNTGYFTKIKERSKKHLQILDNQFSLFVLVAFTTRSIVPDFVTVKIVRKKMHRSVFILAAIVGKIFVYFPIALGSAGLLNER